MRSLKTKAICNLSKVCVDPHAVGLVRKMGRYICTHISIFVPAIAYYLMWVLGVLLFAELVFYTTKLM